PTTTTNETVFLVRRPEEPVCPLLQERTFVKTNVMRVDTSFYWTKPPEGILAAHYPLLRFVETRISGLTTEAIVLTNYYSQTYGSLNHNNFELFVFEPGLEPGLSPATLNELNAKNIQLIYLRTEAGRSGAFCVLGFDGKFREL
ncbi:MAG TPA: hypothetical protein VEC99_04445, partial [Clostridia bacterium]|nr:hypothetical protein [Clostridia bacterium]